MDKVVELERDLAVHLAECNGRYKVLEADVKSLGTQIKTLGEKLEEHMEAAQTYREKVLEAGNKLKQTLLYGFLGLLATMLLGPDSGLKLVTTLLRGGAP